MMDRHKAHDSNKMPAQPIPFRENRRGRDRAAAELYPGVAVVVRSCPCERVRLFFPSLPGTPAEPEGSHEFADVIPLLFMTSLLFIDRQLG
ncbi:MAG TPA: hypothetical protein VGN34_33770 [Ktedonobacteraceae bacterium]